MKFLVDAQLPRRLAQFLQGQGYDTVHTQDLPQGNATSDADVNLLSMHEERIVVTQDADFVQSFLLQQKPYKLLLVSTGNVKNADLARLFQENLTLLTEALKTHRYIELGWNTMAIHQ